MGDDGGGGDAARSAGKGTSERTRGRERRAGGAAVEGERASGAGKVSKLVTVSSDFANAKRLTVFVSMTVASIQSS